MAPQSDDQGDILRVATENVAAADERFRSVHVGASIDDIIDDFRVIGPLVDLDDAGMRAYAEAVTAGRPFTLPVVTRDLPQE
ncbi:hypothetical protein [Microbacterium sp. CR_7]|uniref:hypothetical protein n=1 Tax=Microbacterium sp. CR_7 TaxID=3055792 RepID=UPI0035C1B196